MSLLNSIKGPEDVKQLNDTQLPVLASEIREKIIQTTSRNGGHVGPNLGVVELTIALHRVFSSPQDAFLFDVSHQGYVHKLLTGRNDSRFDKLRNAEGLSGFLNRKRLINDAQTDHLIRLTTFEQLLVYHEGNNKDAQSQTIYLPTSPSHLLSFDLQL